MQFFSDTTYKKWAPGQKMGIEYNPFGAPLANRSWNIKEELNKVQIASHTFAANTEGWAGTGSSTVQATGGRLQFSSSSTNVSVGKTYTTGTGKRYRLSADIDPNALPTGVELEITGYNNAILLNAPIGSVGHRQIDFVSNSTSITVKLKLTGTAAGTRVVYLDNVKLEEIKGDMSGSRFGFNGKEMDDETYGEGNCYDYGFRIYNPRLGRFLSVDPLTSSYPWYTPYQFAGNKPILAVDLDGLEEAYFHMFYDEAGKVFFAMEEAIDVKDQIVPNAMIIVHHMSDGSVQEVFVNMCTIYGGTGMLTASNLPKEENNSNGFDVIKGKLSASAGVGKELSITSISLDESLNNLYAGKSFANLSNESVLGGVEASAGIGIGRGTFNNLGPYDNPQGIFLNANGAEGEVSIPLLGGFNLSVAHEYGNTSDGKGYTSNTIGISFGKGLKDVGVDIQGANVPASFNPPNGSSFALTKLQPASFMDSARMAIKNPKDSISIKFMNSIIGNTERASKLDKVE